MDNKILGNWNKLGDDKTLGNGNTLGHWNKLGDDNTLGNGNTLGHWNKLGDDNTLGNGNTLGDGFKFGKRLKIEGVDEFYEKALSEGKRRYARVVKAAAEALAEDVRESGITGGWDERN